MIGLISLVALLQGYCNRDWQTSHLEKVLRAALASSRPVGGASLPAKAAVGLSPARQSELIRLYACGASTYQLAHQFKIRRDMVTTYVKRAGLEVRPGPQAALDETAEREVASLYKSGLSLRRVGERVEVSDNTVLKALHAQGVDSRPRRDGNGRKPS